FLKHRTRVSVPPPDIPHWISRPASVSSSSTSIVTTLDSPPGFLTIRSPILPTPSSDQSTLISGQPTLMCALLWWTRGTTVEPVSDSVSNRITQPAVWVGLSTLGGWLPLVPYAAATTPDRRSEE